MDLYRHLQVLWRFRSIIAVGAILGVAIAILLTFNVSLSGLSYRKPEVWTATSRVLVTQAGFPWGRTVLGAPLAGSVDAGTTAASGEGGPKPAFADPARLSYLSVVYANFLMGDEIKTMLDSIPPGMQIEAAPIRDGLASNAAALPIIQLSTSSTNAQGATRVNKDAQDALRRYLAQEQNSSGTPDEQRTRLDTIAAASGATLSQGRSLTGPLAAFLLSVLAAVGFAYALENVRPSWPDDDDMMDQGDSPDDLLEPVAIVPMEHTGR